MLVQDGDLLVLGDLVFPYRASDGPSLRFEETEIALSLQGKTVALHVSEEEGDWKKLERMTPAQLADVRFLFLDGEIDPSRLPILKKLASINPGIGLGLDSDPLVAQVLALFKPRIVVCHLSLFEKGSAEVFSSLVDVEFLALDAELDADHQKSAGLGFLSRLPKLRALVITSWDPEPGERLPEGLDRLESLTIGDSKLPDLSAIAHLTSLKSLHILDGEEMTDIGVLAAFHDLKTLSLHGCPKLSDLSVLARLPGLRWLALPPGISQEDFARVIREHADLEVVELVECENVKDLSPLASLEGLEALVLVDTPADLAPVSPMMGLRLLVLPKKTFEDSPDEVRKLDESLPGTLIVEGEGVCLGSGWILLLLPVGGAGWALGARGRSRSASAPGHA